LNAVVARKGAVTAPSRFYIRQMPVLVIQFTPLCANC
jgi:hypothetical protein